MSALEWPDIITMRKQMILQVLFLFEEFIAGFNRTFKFSLMTLHMPLEFRLADEVTIGAD